MSFLSPPIPTHGTSVVHTPGQAVPSGTFSPAMTMQNAYTRVASGDAEYPRDRSDSPFIAANITVIPYGEAGQLPLRDIMAGSWMFTTSPGPGQNTKALGCFTLAQVNDMLQHLDSRARERAQQLEPDSPLNFLRYSEKQVADERSKDVFRLVTKRGILELFSWYGAASHNLPESAPKNPEAMFAVQGPRDMQDLILGNVRLGDHVWLVLKRRRDAASTHGFGAFAYHPLSLPHDRLPSAADMHYKDHAGFDQEGACIYVGYITQSKSGRPSVNTARRACGLSDKSGYVSSTRDAYYATRELPYVEICLHQRTHSSVFVAV